jgi:hypothetical protein
VVPLGKVAGTLKYSYLIRLMTWMKTKSNKRSNSLGTVFSYERGRCQNDMSTELERV